MKITLSNYELELAKEIANSRFSSKRAKISSTRFDGSDYSPKDDSIGVISELAVAKYFGCDINHDIYLNKGDNHESDLKLRIPVEVKGTPTKKINCRLVFNSLNQIRSEFIVLVRVVQSDIDILGWISKDRFLKIKNFSPINPLYGNKYWVQKNDLDSIDSLGSSMKKFMFNKLLVNGGI